MEQFFHDVVMAKIQGTGAMTVELISEYLGRSKESLDEIVLSIQLDLAASTYASTYSGYI